MWSPLRLYRTHLQCRYREAIVEQSRGGAEPTFPDLVSQLCTQAQMRSPAYLALCERFRIDTVYRRKKWEYAYILQALEEQGQRKPGKRGLGFGVGRECIVSALASEGCAVVATDLPHADASRKGWAKTDQYAGALGRLNEAKLCDDASFRRLVEYRDVNMNAIPEDLGGFDFLWSSCALEHLGTLELGSRFVERAMNCLAPGGIAVHTTEYNLGSNDRTVEKGPTSLYRRRDLEELRRRLEAAGHWMAPFNFHPGTGELDQYIDLPPYHWSPHLRLLVRGHAITSVGFVVRKHAA